MPDIPVDLIATGGKLTLPQGMPQPPRAGGKVPPPKAPAPAAPTAPKPPPKAADTKGTPPADPDKQPEHAHTATPCKHCGWYPTVNPVEPTREELLAFVNSVRRGEPYAATVSLWDGAAVVVFRTLSPDEESRVESEMTAWRASHGLMNYDMVAAATRYVDLRMGLAVEKLTVGKDVYRQPADTSDLESLTKGVTKACKTDPVLQVVRWQFGRFANVVTTIQARALDPSFSPATASSGRSASPPSAAG